MFYIIATPIGNLEDLTYRAVRILASCDYVLCEDTRKSRTLLKHYDINTRLVSFHKFSEKRKESSIIDDLKEGKDIALISDAGTPLLSDPGESLVRKCIEEDIALTHLPGPSSVMAALVLSGFASEPFAFWGFLPKKKGEHQKTIIKLLSFEGTAIAFESPHRIEKTLLEINSHAPKRKIAVVREITKRFEEALRGTAKEILERFKKKPPKGEIVLVIEQEKLEDLSFDERVQRLQTKGVPEKKALKMAKKIKTDQSNPKDLNNNII